MRAFLSTLVAAALLGHAVADAHWHERHFCVECSSTAAGNLAADCCRQHTTGHEHDSGPSGPCDCQLSCVGGCDYLPAQKVLLDAGQLHSPVDAAVAPFASIDHYLSLNPLFRKSVGSQAESSPLRLHLLHQILLI
jgi:hypothetical protein